MRKDTVTQEECTFTGNYPLGVADDIRAGQMGIAVGHHIGLFHLLYLIIKEPDC